MNSSLSPLSAWLRAYVLDWIIIVLALAAAVIACRATAWGLSPTWHFPTFFIVKFIVGTRQHGLAILAHDGAHGLISNDRRVNDLYTRAALIPLGGSLPDYRVFHLKHHHFVGTERDPELEHKNHRWLGQWQLPFRWWKLWLQVLLDELLIGAIPHMIMVIRLTGAKKPLNIMRIQAWPVGVSLLCVLASPFIHYLWVAPLIWYAALFSSFWTCFRLRVWGEHVGASPTHSISTSGFWGFMMRQIVFPHNSEFHDVHHKCPTIPFSQLPEAATAFVPRVSLRETLNRLGRT